jgi:hypothetical protein
MQRGVCAAAELERSVIGLRLRGICKCTDVIGRDVDQADARPESARASAASRNAGQLARTCDDRLWNMIGYPMETATTAARIILAGVFERSLLSTLCSHIAKGSCRVRSGDWTGAGMYGLN